MQRRSVSAAPALGSGAGNAAAYAAATAALDAPAAAASSSAAPDAEPDNCVICLEPLDDTAHALPCSHRFHPACLIPWQLAT